eukprot:11170410-Lingulodinium_polyedra.AAC.1
MRRSWKFSTPVESSGCLETTSRRAGDSRARTASPMWISCPRCISYSNRRGALCGFLFGRSARAPRVKAARVRR